MGLETGTTISDLDESWPTAEDPVSQGDDHIRLIKQVLKDQFQGAGLGLGDGLDAPVYASAMELNQTIGATANFQNQIDDINAQTFVPAGTVMIFGQANAPDGWTALSSASGSYLRMVAGGSGGGSSAGAVDLKDANFAHKHIVGGHRLSSDEVPPHFHQMLNNGTATESQPGSAPGTQEFIAWKGNFGSSNDYNYTLAGIAGGATSGRTSEEGGSGGQANNHDHGDTSFSYLWEETWDPKYYNVIRASKN